MKRIALSILLFVLAIVNAEAQTYGGTVIPDTYFKSGRPWCDVRANGAKGDTVTDDSAAFAACITTLGNISTGLGGILYVPPGNYCIKSATIDTTSLGGSITILGSSAQSSTLNACGTNITVLRLNTSHSWLLNIQINGDGIQGGGGAGTVSAITLPAVILDTGCVGCRVDHAIIEGGTIPLLIKGADSYIGDVNINSGYGAGNVQITTSSGGVAVHFVRTNFDSSVPTGVAPTTTPAAWQANHAYTVNTIVSTQGFYIQATVAGTSGGSAPTLQPYSLNITDNTVTWVLVGPVAYCGLSVESGAFEIDITGADFSNAYGTAAICMTNVNPGSVPALVKVNNSVLSNVLGPEVVNLVAGNGLTLISSEIFSCVPTTSCPHINIAATFGGDVMLSNNWFAGAFNGISAASGKFVAIGNVFGSTNGSVTNGVNVSAGVTDFIVNDNYFENVTTGVLVNVGASNRYRILSNNFASGVTTPVNDGGTGTDKSVDAAWTAYTPVAACVGGGAITATVSGRYQIRAKTLILAMAFKATANTCVSSFTATLPAGFTAANQGVAQYAVPIMDATTNAPGVGLVAANGTTLNFLITPTTTDQLYLQTTIEVQ